MPNNFNITPLGTNEVIFGTTGNAAVITRNITTSSISYFFSADWGTALGTSDTALLDGVFDSTTENSTEPNILEVITGSAVDFTRTDNVLRVEYYGSTGGLVVKGNHHARGTSHYGRVFFRDGETDGNNNHPFKYGSGLSGNAVTLVPLNRHTNGTANRISIRIYYNSAGEEQSYPNIEWTWIRSPSFPTASTTNYPLPLNTFVRYEYFLEYVTSTTYRIWPRVYSYNNADPFDTGTLLGDADDFFAQDSTTVSLQTYYDGGGTFGVSSGVPDAIEEFALGNEGPVIADTGGEYYYFADLAMSTDGWIGAQ